MSLSAPHLHEDVGIGLFALREFSKGEFICPYFGTWVRRSSSGHEYRRSSGYVIEYRGLNRKHWAYEIHRDSPAVFANTEQVTGYQLYKKSNALISEVWQDWHDFQKEKKSGQGFQFLEATSDIATGDEIITQYGPQFKPTHEHNVSVSIFCPINFVIVSPIFTLFRMTMH